MFKISTERWEVELHPFKNGIAPLKIRNKISRQNKDWPMRYIIKDMKIADTPNFFSATYARVKKKKTR